jgi:G3E family GTPase
MEVLKVPVTVITGILGSGKTTFVKHVLAGDHGKRIAVIQNEVSEQMGIESPAMTDGEGNVLPDFYELPNGCICCSARDGLIVTLERVISVSKTRPIDAVLVETTGIADPQSVAQVFWIDSGADSPLYLNGIVTFVDSMNIHKFLQGDKLGLADVAIKQIACADAIILNKTDLTTETDLSAVTASITALNSTSPITHTSFSVAPWSILFTIDAFRSTTERKRWPLTPHSHYQGVDHVFIKTNNSESPEQVTRRIADLLWERSCGEIYRCKGLFSFDGGWFSLQGVGEIFEIVPVTTKHEDEDKSGKFLFIGTSLNTEKLNLMFQ